MIKIFLTISFLFVISFFIGFTAWKTYDAGVFNRVESQLNMGIYDRAYDVQFFTNLPKNYPDNLLSVKSNSFINTLANAIAWDKPVFDSISKDLYRPEKYISQLNINYQFPSITTKAFYQSNLNYHPKGLIVIIPGYGMEASDIFTKEDTPLSGLSQLIINLNYNLLVFEPIKSPYMAATINTRLIMSDYQLHGLQSRQVCDAINALNQKNNYRSIIIYGIGSGGLIADITSVLCNQRTTVIIDGLAMPVKNSLWHMIRKHIVNHPLIYQFREPLLQHLNSINFVNHSSSDKYYILDSASMESVNNELKDKLSPMNNTSSMEKKIFFIERQNVKKVDYDAIMFRHILNKQPLPESTLYKQKKNIK